MKAAHDKLTELKKESNAPLQAQRRSQLVNTLLLSSFILSLATSLSLYFKGEFLIASLAIQVMPLCIVSYLLNTLDFKIAPGLVFTSGLCLITVAIDSFVSLRLDFHLLLLAYLPLPNLTLPNCAKKIYLSMTIFITVCAVFVFFRKWNFTDAHFLAVENQIKLLVVMASAFIFAAGVYFSKKHYDEDLKSIIDDQYSKENQIRISDLSRMTAGIAHEINNPLAVIKTSASFFLKRINNDSISKERQRKELLRIIGQVDRVVKIVNGLGTVSKTTGKGPVQTVNVNSMMKKVFELCRHKFTRLGIDHHLTLPTQDLYCQMVSSDMEQALLSLISNSLDAVEKENDKVINLSLIQEVNEKIAIKVIDNGEGIPSTLNKEIMKPFFTTKPLGKGTGLGLSVTREIVNKYSGILEFESSQEMTTFTIRLPRCNEGEEEQRELKAA